MADKTLPTLTNTTAAALAGTTEMIVRRAASTDDEALTFAELIDYLNDSLQVIDATLTALAAYNTNGFLCQTAADIFVGRTITGGIGTTVTNGDGVAGNPTVVGSANAIIKNVGITIDGGGSAISTGVKGYITVPYAMTITGWTLTGDVSGSIVIDVWKDTYANYPPTVADTIAGTEKPTITTATKGQDLSLSSWTTTVTAGDVLGFNVDSCTTITKATLIIQGTLSS